MAMEMSWPMDWTELNAELLPLIAQKLGDITDFIRFRAVCKQWRLATDFSDNPPQFPWLMQLKIGDMPEICFHCLPSCKTFSVSFLGALPMNCNQGVHNEFLLEERGEEDYYNFGRNPIFQVKFDHLGRDVSRREIVPLPPVGVLSKLLNFQVSDKNKRPTMIAPFKRYLAHHKGRIFILSTGHATKSDRVLLIDDTTGRLVSTVTCPEELSAHCCLISTRDGLLMVIKKYAPSIDDVIYEDFQFVVYRLENYDKKPHWTKLSGIGDMMLFLDEYNSFGLIASDYDKFSGNCIYFITKLKGSSESHPTHYLLVGYDMAKNRSFEVCTLGEPSPYETRLFWFLPTLY